MTSYVWRYSQNYLQKMNVVYVIIMFLEVDLSNQNTIVQTHIVLTCIVCK